MSMQLDLNKPFTTQDVAMLIASKDDSANRQLRVTTEGIAYLSDEIGNIDIDGLAFRFETWIAENGYCGDEAAKDRTWVRKIEDDLRTNWPNPTRNYID
jgi:hypothetical protein